VTQLRAAHARGETAAGLDVVKGEVGDMWALGIREAYKSKLQVHTKKRTHISCVAAVAPW
jgi:chaperonin GroEL (HSP60 family)